MAFSIGVDFGTSNTVVALAGRKRPGGSGTVRSPNGQSLDVFVSALCFWG